MAGEAEDNIVIPKVEGTPSPLPKDTGVDKPVDKEAEAKAAAEKAAADKAAAEAKAKEEADKAGGDDDDDSQDNKDWQKDYIDIPDEAARSVINMLREAGVSPVEANSIFEDALKHDDLSKIKWDVLESRLGKDKAHLAKIGITDYYTREYSKNVQTTKTAHELVNGADNWKKLANWVKKAEAADPSRKAEFDELRRGIDMGGRYAKQAVLDLKALYEKDGKNSSLGGKITTGDKVNNAGLVPMTKAEYVAELQKHGDNIKPAVYAELRSRRRAGMQAGI